MTTFIQQFFDVYTLSLINLRLVKPTFTVALQDFSRSPQSIQNKTDTSQIIYQVKLGGFRNNYRCLIWYFGSLLSLDEKRVPTLISELAILSTSLTVEPRLYLKSRRTFKQEELVEFSPRIQNSLSTVNKVHEGQNVGLAEIWQDQTVPTSFLGQFQHIRAQSPHGEEVAVNHLTFQRPHFIITQRTLQDTNSEWDKNVNTAYFLQIHINSWKVDGLLSWRQCFSEN